MSVIAMQQNWIDIMTKDKKAVIEHLKNLLFGDETGYNLCVINEDSVLITDDGWLSWKKVEFNELKNI